MPGIHKSKGSAALGIIASVTFGALTILTFNNVGQYILAKSAVEQAARAAARCLTPTDPECVKILGASPGDSSLSKEWYGFLPEAQADKSTTLDLYKYSASIDRQITSATYNSYEWRMQDVLARWEEVRLPTVSFEGTLNRYARLFGTVSLPTRIVQKELRPLFEPPYVNFPASPVTDNRNNYASITQLIELQNEYGNIIPWGIVDSDPSLANVRTTRESDGEYYFIPPSKDKLIVYSPEIRIPTVPNYPCKTHLGEACHDDINQSAILDPKQQIDEKNLWAFAHLALIPAAVIKNKGKSGTTLRWSENFDNSGGQLKNGLWVEVFDQNGKYALTYCLGARTTHNFKANTTIPFNMDIVGPRGANDGIPGDCVVPKGVGDFSSVKIPRGGSFRIKAMLRRHDDNVGAEELLAQVRFLYWFDQYKVVDAQNGAGPSLTCPAMFSATLNRPQCEEIDPTRCSGYLQGLLVDKNFCKNNWRTSWKATRWEPHCGQVEHAFYIDDKMRSYHSVIGPKGLPICDENWQPQYSGALNAFSKVCSWNKTEGKDILLGDVTGECPLAKRASKSEYCGKHLYASVSHKNILEKCPEVLPRLSTKEISESYNYLKNKYASYGIEAEFGLRSFVPVGVSSSASTWDLKYTNLDYDGNEITNSKQIRAYAGKNPKQVNFVNYKKKFGYPKIDKDSFIPKIIAENAGHGRWVYGWDQMIRNLQVFQEEERVVVDDVWPFVAAALDAKNAFVPRPYHRGLERAYAYDYNNDCVIDSKCDLLNANYESLEDALRTFATKSKKIEIDLSDASYEFNWAEEFRERISADPESDDYPECSQYMTVGCARSGPFRIALGGSESEPESCKNGTYVNCYSLDRYQVNSFAEYQTSVDLQPAKRAALYEMQRLIPFIQDCTKADKAGCASIEIDSSSQMEVLVNTKINMPISFPLNAFWGDSIVVESNLNSVREIGRLG